MEPCGKRVASDQLTKLRISQRVEPHCHWRHAVGEGTFGSFQERDAKTDLRLFWSIPAFLAASKRCSLRGQAAPDQESPKLRNKLWWACLAALPGSFQYGWGLSVINVPQASICSSLALAEGSLAWSVLVAILSPSGLIGAWLGPAIVRRLGLVRALRSTAAFFLVSGALFPMSAQAASTNLPLAYVLFALGRVIAGVGAGAATVFVPLYLGQIAPLELRGAIGNLHQAGCNI